MCTLPPRPPVIPQPIRGLSKFDDCGTIRVGDRHRMNCRQSLEFLTLPASRVEVE
jgi:hypothetical protein